MRNSQNSKIAGLKKKEDVEKKLLDRFPEFNDNQQFHNLFCSYDFHESEKSLLEFWKDVIEFLFESIKNTHGIKLEEMLDYIKIKGKKPLCLSNITIKLIEEGDLIPSSMLSNDDYYKKYFHDMINIKDTWGKWIKKNISSYFFKDAQYVPKNNEILLKKKLFLEFNDQIIRIIGDLLNDEDSAVLTINDLRHSCRKNDLDDSLIDHSLTFLDKTRKISTFIVKIEGNEIKCVKFLKNNNSSVSLKDTAIINLSLSIKKIDRTIIELDSKIEEAKIKAKEYLQKKDKQQASNVMKKKILFQKTHDYYFNMKLSLEQNLLDIKSMESNQNIHNVLIESSKATHTLKINLSDFENVADKMKDNVENLRDANEIMNDFNSDALNNEDLEKELNDLQIAEDKASKESIILEEDQKKVSNHEKNNLSRLFPNANMNNIKSNDINENLINEKENFINDNSFQEILEEMNKK